MKELSNLCRLTCISLLILVGFHKTHLILLENMLLIPLYFNFNIWYSNQNFTTSSCIPRDEKCEGIKNRPLNFYQIRALAALMI